MILIANYNIEPNEATKFDFCQVYNMCNLIRYYTCYKSPESPSCIEWTLTNKPKSFLKSAVIKTGLSGFHKMTRKQFKT